MYDLMGWLPALDHLQSNEKLHNVTLNAISAGNTSEDDSRRALEQLQSLVIQPRAKIKRRAKGQSPF